MSFLKKALPWVPALFIAAIFLDSLRFKFTGHPTPKHIFETLRDWSGIGLFYPAGPWIIGLGELLAALLVLILPVIFLLRKNTLRLRQSQMIGGLLAVAIMSGAIVFHLFTPLGIETPVEWNGDMIVEQSPALFISACVTWLCGAGLALYRRAQLKA